MLGCKKKTDDDSLPSPNPPVGTVNDDLGFNLRYITDSKYTYDIHKDSAFGAACTAATGEDITCILDAEELDLHFNGVTLQYNVPSSLCSYVVFAPYAFWNFAAGTGPTDVQIDTDKNGTVGLDTDNNGVINTPSSSVANCQSGAFDFDHSTLVPPGPNCCVGYYTLVNRTWDATLNTGAGGYTVATTPNTPWGGSAAACLYGPGVDTQKKDSQNFPMADIYFVEGSGINKSYAIEAPIKKVSGSNIYAANYFEAGDHTGGFYAGYNSLMPDYSVYCLDRAHETVAAIHLQIREWNSSAAFAARVTTPTAHSLTGTEPAPFGAKNINDFADWKDFADAYPGIR